MHFVHTVLSPLSTHVFTIANDQVTVSELLGFITGIACVWLTVKQRVSNFPVGIANSLFFLLLFLDAHFYADAYLQIVYVVLGLQGWWTWLYLGGRDKPLVVTLASKLELTLAVGFIGLATAILYPILSHAHDIAPFLDALTTALSLGAQWLLNFKRLQNWIFWMIADVIYIPLYAVKRLDLTSLVYVAFLGMCVVGWFQWSASIKQARLQPVTA